MKKNNDTPPEELNIVEAVDESLKNTKQFDYEQGGDKDKPLESAFSQVLEKGKNFVSMSTKGGQMKQEAIDIFTEACRIKKEDLLPREESLDFFKNSHSDIFEYACPDFIVKNGIIITSSIESMVGYFYNVEAGNVVITLPHIENREDGRVISHRAQIITREEPFWVDRPFFKRDVSPEHIKAWTVENLEKSFKKED